MAGPVGLSPTAWYDPSDPTGTTLSGSDVTNLVDLSGHGRDTPGSGTNPRLDDTINGLDAIAFNGTNQYLGSGPALSAIFNASAYTVAGVCRFNTIGTDDTRYDFNDNLFSDVGGDLAIYARSSGVIGVGQWDGGRQQSALPYAVGDDVVFILWKDSGTLHLEVNGAVASAATGVGSLSGGNLLFGQASTSGIFADVTMGEWLSFDTALDSTDRGDLIAYLEAKWLPATLSIAPTVDVSFDLTLTPPPVAQRVRLTPVVSGATLAPIRARLSTDDNPAGIAIKTFRHPDYRHPQAVITKGKAKRWDDRLNETGSGGFQIQNRETDRDLIDPDDLIRFELDGDAVFAMVVDQDTSRTQALDLEDGQYTEFTGPGHLGLLSEAIVYPVRGADVLPMPEDRLFSWPAPDFDVSSWRAATEITTVLDAVGVWPLDFGGFFAGGGHQFPDGSAPILGPSSGTPTTAPVGTCYFRGIIDAPDTTRYILYLAADNTVTLYIDGQKFAESNDLTSTTTVVIDLTAGPHTWAAEVFSGAQLPPADPTESNPLGISLAWYKADLAGKPIGTLLGHATSDDTRIVEYPDGPPGITIGQILQILFFEATAAGSLPGWALTFDDKVDSAGAPWAITGDISTKVGTDLRTFLLDELSETYADFRAQPGGLVLDAYNKGTIGRSIEFTLHPPTDVDDPTSGNTAELTHTRKAVTATRLLVKWAGGWHTVDATPDGARPKEAVLGLGSVQSVAEVERIALEQLGKYADIRQAITVTWVPTGTDDRPYTVATVGDTITVPDRDGADTVQQILSLQAAEGDDAVIQWTCEIGDVLALAEQRYEQALKKMSDGTIRGDSTVAQPLSQVAGLASPSCCPPQPPGGA